MPGLPYCLNESPAHPPGMPHRNKHSELNASFFKCSWSIRIAQPYWKPRSEENRQLSRQTDAGRCIRGCCTVLINPSVAIFLVLSLPNLLLMSTLKGIGHEQPLLCRCSTWGKQSAFYLLVTRNVKYAFYSLASHKNPQCRLWVCIKCIAWKICKAKWCNNNNNRPLVLPWEILKNQQVERRMMQQN